ncbi:MAG: kinase [Saprospiraceae bacterium]|jgi:D-glycero-alpha-D-manno-heptose-7-phosphate kinase|nr:kinase [Saprospiraceae bacterium]
MIISKTPLRISFFGGGTDYPDFFQKHGGAVLSTTVDKYVYITVNKMSQITDFPYKVTYSKTEKCHSIDEIQHPSVKACLQYLGIKEGIEIHIVNELPAKTGLGSSSSFTVGLLNALHAYQGKKIDKIQLAKMAIHVEQDIIGEKVGVQDQSAAAIGGFNKLEFLSNQILVNPLANYPDKLSALDDNLMLFYTGIQRFAEDIIPQQIENTKNSVIVPDLLSLKSMVDTGYEILSSNAPLSDFGVLLDEAWRHKKRLSKVISNDLLDDIYAIAIECGALGGKLLGAGGGGFYLFYVEKENQRKVKKGLSHLQEIPFHFDTKGSQIVFAE